MRLNPTKLPAAILLTFLVCAILPAQTTFSNTTAITLAAGSPANSPFSPYPSNITVSGMTGTISNVTVSLSNLSHTRPDDLAMLLVGPGGQSFLLWSDVGGNTGVTGLNITLTDAAANQLPDAGPLAAGSFKPTAVESTNETFASPAPAIGNKAAPKGTATFASVFNGLTANGTWSLYVIDDSLGQEGSIAGGWSITITTAVASQPTATTLASSVNPSLVGQSTTFTATVTSSGNPVTLGTVNFLAGATVLGSNVPLNGSGQATLTTSFPSEGTLSISAAYSGATGFGASSGSITQIVNNATTVSGNTFCNPGPNSIPDSGSPAVPYPSNLFVSGLSGSITKATLSLNGFTSARPDDIEMLLVGPTGATFVFLSDTGGSNSFSGNLTFDDAAANLLPDEGAIAAGTFRPTAVNSLSGAVFPAPAPAGPYNFAAPFATSTFATVFNGTSPNGTWRLFIVDDALGSTASSLSGGWCMTFFTSADPATTTTITSSQNPSFTNAQVTYTATVLRSSNSSPATQGTVTFRSGATVLAGPVAVNASGQASFNTTFTTEGTRQISADYSGFPGSFGLSSGSVSQEVNNQTTVSGTSFCNPGPLTINSNGAGTPYPAKIFVSGLPASFAKVTLTLNSLTHSRPGDIELLLVGPTGTNFVPLGDVGGISAASGVNLTLDDTAANLLPDAVPLASGTFRPTAYSTVSFPSPAPSGPWNLSSPAGSATFASSFGGSDPNGPWQIFAADDSLGDGGAFAGGACLNFTLNPDLTITKTHSGNFSQGQTGATYTITVTNSGGGPTSGTVTVTDTLPAGLTATAISGLGWNCTLGTLTCTRNDVLIAGQSYAAIILTVNVASNAPASVTNQAAVSGGGETNTSNNSASDITSIDVVLPPDLTISKTHSGNFTQGQTGATYTLTATNSGGGPTSGTVTVTDTLPVGLNATAISGAGWSCTLATLTCTRNDVLTAGQSYAAITLTVNVASNAPASVTNTATVSGGGETNTSNNSASDATTIGSTAFTSLSGLITAKSGPQNARVWTFNIRNLGPAGATGAAFNSLTLTQQAGAACTPVVTTPLPVNLGAIAVNGSANALVTINFTGCAATARFQVGFTFSANGGAAAGSRILYNQFF